MLEYIDSVDYLMTNGENKTQWTEISKIILTISIKLL